MSERPLLARAARLAARPCAGRRGGGGSGGGQCGRRSGGQGKGKGKGKGQGEGREREGAAFILPLYSTRFGVAGRIPYCVWGVAEQSERGLVKFPGLPPTPLPHLLETFPFLAMLFSVQEKGWIILHLFPRWLLWWCVEIGISLELPPSLAPSLWRKHRFELSFFISS